MLEKRKTSERALGVRDLAALRWICKGPSLTSTRSSLGREDSGGSAEENDHSSSSAVAGGAAGLGVAGLDENWGEARAAKGSMGAGAFWGGGLENEDCWDRFSCGVFDWDPAGFDVNPEKGEKGGGVGDGALALLCWVTDDSKAGPGTSR